MQTYLPGSPFKSRTISVVKDFSLDEQLYLYEKTRELKAAIQNKEDLSRFRINNPEIGIYIIFLENSTRTKESFKNAAQFHNSRLNVFDALSSSFNKEESYSDTFKMLCGYNNYSIFVIRTKHEGVCRWLESSLGEYADRNGIDKPSFINGGDGKHEHPTQEYLDEFTFYEHKKWKRDYIHIALIGDLFHGRTVHSKAYGLNIFNKVSIDLVAPPELAMPEQYLTVMENNGYKIRFFHSIKEYLKQSEIADVWYFTRLQLERMGEDIKERSEQLRDAVTFKKEFYSNLPEGTKFYHPLPRHRITPTLPFFLDNTPLNGWELQALNGYYTRIIALGMVGGVLGEDFTGKHPVVPDYIDDFIEEIRPVDHYKNDYKVGIKPIYNGIVIDHIGKGDDEETIWKHIDKVRRILDLNVQSSHGVFCSQKTKKIKGIISLPDVKDFNEKSIKKLAAIAPECTLNIIENHKVTKKFRLHTPPRVYNFEEISCTNLDCISHAANFEHVQTEFFRSSTNTFICKFCEKPHTFKEIWN